MDSKGPVPGISGAVGEYLDKEGELRQNALLAGTPEGYVQSFKDAKGSTEQIGYLTYKNIESGKYDVEECAKFCNNEKFCLGFNIFYERDPSSDPNPKCKDPKPVTNVKVCSMVLSAVPKTNSSSAPSTATLLPPRPLPTRDSGARISKWSSPAATVRPFTLCSSNNTNNSSGYSKATTQPWSAPKADGFETPKSLKAAVNAPLLPNGYDTYNGMRLFNNNPYDPSLCAAACQAQGEWDSQHHKEDGSYKPCNFFTSYILTKNGVPLGTYCALYTNSWLEDKYAVNTGYYYGDDVYSVVFAAGYSATNPDLGGGRGPEPQVEDQSKPQAEDQSEPL